MPGWELLEGIQQDLENEDTFLLTLLGVTLVIILLFCVFFRALGQENGPGGLKLASQTIN